MKAKIPDFVAYLQDLDKTGPELDSYKENLDDAIQATQDALDAATKAEKEISAPIPSQTLIVRRGKMFSRTMSETQTHVRFVIDECSATPQD